MGNKQNTPLVFMQLTVQGEGRKESLENDKNASPVKDNDRPPD